MKKFLTITKTELKLSLRSFDAIFFALVMPVIVVIIIGLIYKGDFKIGAYISIGICAIGLMGLPLVLADYREKKILKRLQVTPASPILLLSVQFLTQFIMALISALLVMIVAVLFFEYRLKGSIILFILSYLLTLISIFSIGILVASLAPNIKKAGFICSIIYFPMLLLSGTTIPFHVLPKGIQSFANFMPITQGIKLLNGISIGGVLSDYLFEIIVLISISIIFLIVAAKNFKWDMK